MPISKWVINYKGEVGIYYAKLSDLLLPSAYIEPILVNDVTKVPNGNNHTLETKDWYEEPLEYKSYKGDWNETLADMSQPYIGSGLDFKPLPWTKLGKTKKLGFIENIINHLRRK